MTLTESELRKIRWKCRRGMLELDVLLAKFFDQHFKNLSAAEQQQFIKFLDASDTDLYQWLIVGTTPPEKSFMKIVEMIKT